MRNQHVSLVQNTIVTMNTNTNFPGGVFVVMKEWEKISRHFSFSFKSKNISIFNKKSYTTFTEKFVNVFSNISLFHLFKC